MGVYCFDWCHAVGLSVCLSIRLSVPNSFQWRVRLLCTALRISLFISIYLIYFCLLPCDAQHSNRYLMHIVICSKDVRNNGLNDDYGDHSRQLPDTSIAWRSTSARQHGVASRCVQRIIAIAVNYLIKATHMSQLIDSRDQFIGQLLARFGKPDFRRQQ